MQNKREHYSEQFTCYTFHQFLALTSKYNLLFQRLVYRKGTSQRDLTCTWVESCNLLLMDLSCLRLQWRMGLSQF